MGFDEKGCRRDPGGFAGRISGVMVNEKGIDDDKGGIIERQGTPGFREVSQTTA